MAIKIYIDQGHNPQNPNAGAEGNGYREQDLVYEIGVRLARILQNNGYETRLSRPSPTTQLGTSNATSLARRVEEANAWGADYFISLHTNASVNPTAGGTEALVYSLASRAYSLANSILEQLNLTTGLRNRGVVPRPGLYVLKRTAMPAVLVELGFITNPGEANLMANSPQLFAEGIANGLIDYISDASQVMATPVQATTPPEVFEGEAVPKTETEADDAAETEDETTLPEAGQGTEPMETEEATYETFEAFIRENNGKGYLKVQASRGEQALPVPGITVRISKEIGDGEYLFFEGETDENGLIDFIELPAPPRENSLEAELPDKTVTYRMQAEGVSFEPMEREISIYDGVKTIQPLTVMLGTGGNHGTAGHS